MIDFACKYCGSRFKLPDARPGQSVTCAQCGGPNLIPYPQPARAPVALSPPDDEARAEDHARAFAIASLISAIIGFCILPAAIVGLILGVFGLRSKTRRGTAVAGIILGGLTLIVAFVRAVSTVTP